MGPIVQAYEAFARAGTDPSECASTMQSFRDDANRVLRMVYERMLRKNSDIYPRIEVA